MALMKMHQVFSLQLSLLLLLTDGITNMCFFTNGCPVPSLDFTTGRRSEEANHVVLYYSDHKPKTIRFEVTSNCYNMSDFAFYVHRHFPSQTPSWKHRCKMGVGITPADCNCTLDTGRVSCDIEETFLESNTQMYHLKEIQNRTMEIKFVVKFIESDDATYITSTTSTANTTQRKMALTTTDSLVLRASQFRISPDNIASTTSTNGTTSTTQGELAPATKDSFVLKASESRLSPERDLTTMVPLWAVLAVVSAIIIIGIVIIVAVKRGRPSTLSAVAIRYRDARTRDEEGRSDPGTATDRGLTLAGRGGRPETVYEHIADSAVQPSIYTTVRRDEECLSGGRGQRLELSFPSSAVFAGVVQSQDDSAMLDLTSGDRNSMQTSYLSVFEPDMLHDQSLDQISSFPETELQPIISVKSPPLPVRKSHPVAAKDIKAIPAPQENPVQSQHSEPHPAFSSPSTAKDDEVVCGGSAIAPTGAENCPKPASPQHIYESLRRNASKSIIPLEQPSQVPPSRDSPSHLQGICHQQAVTTDARERDLSRFGSDEFFILFGPGQGNGKPPESPAPTIRVPTARQHSTSSETSEIHLPPNNVILIKFESPLQSPVSIVARPAWGNPGYADSPLAGDQDQ